MPRTHTFFLLSDSIYKKGQLGQGPRKRGDKFLRAREAEQLAEITGTALDMFP
jgi:hypothetical protein